MPSAAPPFRADHVGSLLRTPALKAARLAAERGELSVAGLAAIEDREIAAVVARQEETGLRAATDGEFRRAMWHYDFLERLEGCERYAPESGIAFKGVATKARGVRVTGKIGFRDHPMLDHFHYLRGRVRTALPKMTIPSPSVLHFRGGRKAISAAVYPDLEEFFADLGRAYARAIAAFGESGCRYLQLDETNLAYLCDPDQRRIIRERGEDPDRLPETYASLINAALAGRPAGMTITMHLCRGNFQSSWIAQGGYEPVAELLFQRIGVDGYFLEYDSDRAGGFEPLRFVPETKTVVLGLVTTKSGALESREELARRIAEAARFVPLERLCLSPQCGFASTEEGNLLTAEEQWAKLARIVDVAREVWGG